MRTEIRIVHHFGASFTENGQLIPSLQKNAELLEKSGVLALPPKKFKSAFFTMLKELDGEPSTAGDQLELLEKLTGDMAVDRLVLSNSNLLGAPAWILAGGQFYRSAASNCREFRELLPSNPCEFFIGISNPAILLPLAFENQKSKSRDKFFGDTDLGSIRWSNVISAIATANPDVEISVWCNEDTPIMWPTILKEVAGLEAHETLHGELDVIEKILSDEGFARLKLYLSERPELNELQIRRVKSKFLEKYFLDKAVDLEIHLPDWNEDLVNFLTDQYEKDLEIIEAIPGVNLITP